MILRRIISVRCGLLPMKIFDISIMGLIVSLGALIIVAVLVEGVLRVGFGFGNPPLYIADEHIGYLLAPNQRVRRFWQPDCD